MIVVCACVLGTHAQICTATTPGLEQCKKSSDECYLKTKSSSHAISILTLPAIQNQNLQELVYINLDCQYLPTPSHLFSPFLYPLPSLLYPLPSLLSPSSSPYPPLPHSHSPFSSSLSFILLVPLLRICKTKGVFPSILLY